MSAPVWLSATRNLPTFVSAQLSPASTIGCFSSLVLTVAHNSPAGAVEFLVYADGGSEPRQQVTIRLLVAP